MFDMPSFLPPPDRLSSLVTTTSQGLAFIKDPDGYWIEIINQGEPKQKRPVDCCGVAIDGGGGYTGGGSAAPPSK